MKTPPKSQQDQSIYIEGGRAFLEALKKCSGPKGLDGPGLERCLSVMPWETRAAVHVFTKWNARHEGAFENFVKTQVERSPESSVTVHREMAQRTHELFSPAAKSAIA
jgi:hypothetical protein